MLTVKNLHFSYGNKPILNGLDLHVNPGQMLGLVGPNGSGKSTVLKLISGVLSTQKGNISIDGQDIDLLQKGQLARLVAIVPQNPIIPSHLTTSEVVLMGRTPHLRLLQWEGKKDLEVVEHAMHLTRCERLSEQPIGNVSGGERQRILVARALAQATLLLLLDEPTASLDLAYQTYILDLIKGLQKNQSLTVVIAIHDLTLASQYCDRLALLHQGTIFAEGSPTEVLTKNHIEAVYNTNVSLLSHPTYGTPVILPVSSQERPA